MNAQFICSACGFQPTAGDKTPAYCMRCGQRLLPPSTATANSAMTIVENSSSVSRSQPSGRLSTALPRAIDGYEIVSLLGYGGMGSVFLAYEPLLDREIALKVLTRHPDDAARAAGTARFLSEAVLTGKLSHAGIIPIHHIGFDPAFGHYYTMRYIRGRTLADVLLLVGGKESAACEEFSLTHLLSIFLRVCQAVGFAHQHGIVHRDIKPANLMVAEFGEVFVLDWGLAKDIGQSPVSQSNRLDEAATTRLSEARKRRGTAAQLFLGRDRKPTGQTSVLRQLQAARPNAPNKPETQACQVLGTPGYMSPEQGSGDSEITPASDVYSLGVTLYQLLTLRSPIEAQTSEELIVKTVLGQIVPIRQLPEACRLPSAVCEIITRALALKPEDRFRDAKEMAEELSLYMEGKAAWKSVVSDSLPGTPDAKNWETLSGRAGAGNGSTFLEAGTRIRCRNFATGDFRSECEFWAGAASTRWKFGVGISEVLPDKSIEGRYHINIGVEDRPYIELLRKGMRVQRRFDVRLQSDQRYTLKIEMEQGHLRVWIGERKYLDYHEVFPQTGGAIELAAELGNVCTTAFSLVSRGAPLNLSFMVLPDRLYRLGRYSEARELYRQLASSHPDREEGLAALYKAGLCSASMQDLQAAFTEFTGLEGTMYDHCCALGLAQIGLQDGNVDWAWEALKNGYRRHRAREIGHEMWFSLLALVERVDCNQVDEKLNRYRDLLSDLDSEPHEAAQLTFELLDLVRSSLGDLAVRREAQQLIERFPNNAFVLGEAVLAMSRAGIDASLLPAARSAVETVINSLQSRSDKSRYHMLRAEFELGDGKLETAASHLRDVILDEHPGSSIGLWAKGWQTLIQYLSKNPQRAITEIHETTVRLRRKSSAQLSYLGLIEAMSSLQRGKLAQAEAALRGCAESDCVWGIAARHIQTRQYPDGLISELSRCQSAQISEALFLCAEIHFHLNNSSLAFAHYQICQKPPFDRAMFQPFISDRLKTISKEAAGIAKEVRC